MILSQLWKERQSCGHLAFMINVDKMLPTDVFTISLLSEGKGEKEVH